MQARTPIFIVTSSRPRVGKTLIARALIEYFCAQKRAVAGFDVNPDEFALVDRLPAYTAAASLENIRDEMALFDQLAADDDAAKVIDLGHVVFERFFSIMQQIDFASEARRHALAPMVLFVADPDDRAKQGYAALAARFPELPLVPLFNEAVPNVVRHMDSFPPTRRGGPAVGIPALSDVLRSVVDRPSFSFVGYIAKSPDPTSELYNWMKRAFVTFRDLEVRLLLGELKPEQLEHLQQSA